MRYYSNMDETVANATKPAGLSGTTQGTTMGPPDSCYQCEEERTFKSKIKLKVHVLQMQSDMMFACTICKKEFKGKQNLVRQIPSRARGRVNNSRAREDADFTCKICQKSFK